MPLSEFLRLAIEKLESSKRKSCSSDLSSRTENDVVELVRENGEIIMQGQSNKVTRTPTHQNRVSDATLGNSITASIEKFGGVESIVDDIAPVVPSGELDLRRNDEMVSWLSYPIDDGLQDYSSELLPEISSVTAKGTSAGNRFVLGDKGSSCDQTVSNLDNDEDAFKFSSSTKARSLYSWLPQQGQASEPSGISGVPCIITNNTSNRQDSIFGIFDQGRDVVSESSSMKMESRNVELPRNNSSFLNFSCLSRPVNLDKANLPFSSGISSVSSGIERMEVKEKGSASRCSNLVEPMDFYVPSAPTVVKEPKESFLAEFCSDTFLKTEKALIQSNIANSTGVLDGDGTVEPVVASSSVSSGNSADRISHEHTHSSKRKFCDIESECHSDEDIQNESVGVKKPTAARGTTRSRKSRTAEVHNLSERRRRDRINEKMRILQELIPNCNKADKASMLDEAIEYLKNLQLQLQIMSLRASLCIPPLMFPPGTQHMYPVSIPHFSPVGVGMGARMSFGNTNGGFPPHCPIFPVPSFQRPHFPSSALGLTNLQGIPKAPLVPLTGRHENSATDSSGLTVPSHNKVPNASSNLNSGDPITTKKSQSMHNPEGSSSIKRNLNQVR